MCNYQSKYFKEDFITNDNITLVYDSHLKVWTICIYDEWYTCTRAFAMKVRKAIRLLNKIKQSHSTLEWR